VLPYWLDRPDGEALDIAVEADRAGFDTLWVGEMATFDAFALATAIGLRTDRIGLRVGPLAVGVRSPVALALGLSSVAGLTGRRVDLALGASSPAIVWGWHDRPWGKAAPRMRETVRAVRGILDGGRVDFAGEHVRVTGFRLRNPLPASSITVAAYGPAMTRVAAEEADEVVLNLVTAEHVAAVRGILDDHAKAVGRPAPRLAVWLAGALDPGSDAIRQLAAQLTVYLAPPGYGEMFSELGHGELVARARAGASRAELLDALPTELIARVCAIGSAQGVIDRIEDYHRAGADHVGVVPCTAQDPGGRALLTALSAQLKENST
jgi:probable F420-dependent oxidoreductase